MRRIFVLLLPVLALAATWAVPTSARAASGVTDDAHFFSPQAIRQADDIIRQNTGHHHSDIRVVTVPSIPDELKGDFASQNESQFFAHWADTLAKRDKVDGVIILICKNPSHVHVEQGNNTREKIFPDADRRELVSKLVTAFKAKMFDDGLVEAVRFIHVRESANASKAGLLTHVPAPNAWSNPPVSTPAPAVPVTTPSHFPAGGFVCLGIVVLVVVFLIISIVNRSRNYGGGYNAPPPGGYPPGYSGPGYSGGGFGGGYGGGGGGFGKGLLGGLLGGAIGAWGYDKLTGRDSNSYNPGTGAGPGAAPPDPTDQPDTSYSGSGGNFGDSSSSDSESTSSSDSGGGDFGGGGDSGGGGGDFGGGGDSGGSGGDF